MGPTISSRTNLSVSFDGRSDRGITLKKGKCLKQVFVVNLVAWNNNIGPLFYFVGLLNEGND